MEADSKPRSYTAIREGGGGGRPTDSRNGSGGENYINMGASDLQRLITKIKSERQSHLDTIKNFDYNSLKEKVMTVILTVMN